MGNSFCVWCWIVVDVLFQRTQEEGEFDVIFREPFNVRHIGIVAGTAEGAALCYQTICREAEPFLGLHAHPEMTMHAFSLRDYLELIDAEQWEAVADLLSQSSANLARAGADFIVCPNNTLHGAFDAVCSPIPWLHIAEVVAAEVCQQGRRRVGLLGTRSVMEGSVYRNKLKKVGVDLELPCAFDQVQLHAMILTEMIRGHLSAPSRYKLYMMIRSMKEQGCDAVILGCTELPLFVTEEQSVLPLLDSTRLLAQAAIRYAIGSRVQTGLSRRLTSPRQDGGPFCADKNKEGVFTE
ncbi:MAG: amino acid racemase [Nitrospira sp.]|nr:amino acid racemase [Nitrospira sp.]